MKSFDQLFPTINVCKAEGIIRSRPEDFVVIELNETDFTESGEHLWLKVQKINSNTAWAATQIASACKVPARQVGFAGQKDRHAITVQWFSVQLPKIKDLNTITCSLPDEMTILEHHWHQSKLKTGQLKGNQFEITVRDIKGDVQSIENNISVIKKQGVPNYFGPQRFGHNLGNIQKSQDWFSGTIKVNNRNLRSMLISSARSHLFNMIVAKRIADKQWNQIIDGDILQLDGSHSWFHAKDGAPAELTQRMEQFDLHITAALWGEDGVQSTTNCAQMEQTIADTLPVYQQGFEKFRVKQDRRAVRILPKDFSHSWLEDNLQLKFKLPAGAFATGILREILSFQDKTTQ